MAFLGAGRPDWQLELGATAGGMLDAVGGAVPALSGLYVRPGGPLELVVTAERLTGGDRVAAVWATAVALSPWWATWLGGEQVSLKVAIPGLTVDSPCSAMTVLAGGAVGRSGWMERCVIRPG